MSMANSSYGVIQRIVMCEISLMSQSLEATQHPVIVLHNTSIEDLKAILSFIYRGQCIVTKVQLNTLLEVAKTLKIQGLCDMKFPEDDTIRDDSPCDFSTKENEIKSEEVKVEPEFDVFTDLSTKDNNNEPSRLSSKISNECNQQTEKRPPDFMTTVFSIPKKPSKDIPETCKCFICGKYLSNQYNLRVHMETHDEAYHACQSCPHVSRSRDALRKHVSYRHPEEYNSRKRRKPDNT